MNYLLLAIIKMKIYFFYANIENKLVTLNFNQKYSVKSYLLLDNLKKSKKLDYSIDLT